MGFFVVERYAAAAPLDDAVATADIAAAPPSDGPAAIRHIRTWFLPADETSFSLFEAPSAEVLRAAGDAAGLHYTRITEAIETTGGAAP